jgi:hypothetical protein
MENQERVTARPQVQFGNLRVPPEEIGTGFLPKALQSEPRVLQIGDRLIGCEGGLLLRRSHGLYSRSPFV